MGVTVLDSPQAAEAAAAALAMVGASPRDAQDAALEARRVSRRRHDRAAESVADRALGLARKELGDLVGARAALRDAVRVADRAGLDDVAAEARMSLAFVLLDSGRVTGALAQADRAVSALRGAAAARLRAQRGLILQRCGRLTEAQAAYQLALPVLARAGDRVDLLGHALQQREQCGVRGILARRVVHDGPLSWNSASVPTTTRPASATSSRRRPRQRPLVGPMLPTGRSRAADTSA